MRVRYLRASEWGMRWARPPIAERQPDVECYVHHTGGGEFPMDAVRAFRQLNEYAINTKGYSALDYDVLVHYDPVTDLLTIGEGRGPWMSAATRDRNEQGEAVCVLGNFENRIPHPAEIEGAALAIKWGMDMGWIARDAVILGHRDNPAHPNATACPGRHFQAQLLTVRQRVQALLTPITPPEKEPTMYTDYFTLRPQPAAVWHRPTGSVVAVRVGPEQFPFLGLDPARIPVLPEAEARRLLFVTAAPFDAVR